MSYDVVYFYRTKLPCPEIFWISQPQQILSRNKEKILSLNNISNDPSLVLNVILFAKEVIYSNYFTLGTFGVDCSKMFWRMLFS